MRTTSWVERLDRGAVRGILSSDRLRDGFRVNYLQAAEGAVDLLQRTGAEKEAGCEAEQVALQLGSKRNRDGQVITLEAEATLNQLVAAIADGIWDSRGDLSRLWPNPVSIPRVRNYLELCIEEEIKGTVMLGTLVLWHRAQDGDESRRDILLVPEARWAKRIESYLRRMGLEVMSFDDGSHHLVARLRRVVSPIVRPRFLLRESWRALRNAKPQAKGPYKVSVPYKRSINLEERNDLFWFEDSGLDPSTVIVSLESPRYPVDDDEFRLLHSHGFAYAIHAEGAGPAAAGDVRQPASRLGRLELDSWWLALKTGLTSWLTRESFWQWSRLMDLMDQVNRLQEYYEAENVRADIGLDWSKSAAVRSIAMDNVGGVRIGLQWSSFERKTSFHSKNDHVFFCWGADQRRAMREARACVEHVLVSGYIYDRYLEGQSSLAKEVRGRLESSGARYVVGLFDERPHEMFYPKEVIEDLYRRLLDECVADPTLGLIIKPKDSSPLNQLDGVRLLLEEAKATGRCLVLEEDSDFRRERRRNNNLFALLPALASDLTVSVSFTTPGRESALAGTRAVYYDCMYLKDHPIYESAASTDLAFRDASSLIQAIRSHRHGDRPGLGDHSTILDDIDPYRDGRAGQRIGSYVHCLLEELNSGVPRDEAICWAVAQYEASWGGHAEVQGQQRLRENKPYIGTSAMRGGSR